MNNARQKDNIRCGLSRAIGEGVILLDRAPEHQHGSSDVLFSEGRAWMASAERIIMLICSSPDDPYRTAAQEFSSRWSYSDLRRKVIEGFIALLHRLQEDLGRGLLGSLENTISAETYDDLLDHADAYLGEDRKDPAGVITGVVFEDTVRRLCRKYGIEEEGRTCEPLVNALTAKQILVGLESKEAKTAAALRTSATHARWDEFKREQVETVIAFTRRLIREKLAT